MNDSPTWYATPSDTAAGTVDANSGFSTVTDAATHAPAATGGGCDKSTDRSPSTHPSTSPDPANA